MRSFAVPESTASPLSELAWLSFADRAAETMSATPEPSSRNALTVAASGKDECHKI